MSARTSDWFPAHGALWYDDARYRLSWLVLPQMAALFIAAFYLSFTAQGDWGRPASGSKERVAELSALRDKAGKDGDAKAFEELKGAAAAGEIDAETKLGTLYDPLTAQYFPKKPVPSEIGKAIALYTPGADVGEVTAISRLADLLLDPSNPNLDLKRGCRFAQAWIDHPETFKRTIDGEESLSVKLAGCYVDEASGLKQNPVRAGELIIAVLWRKHQPTIKNIVNNLGMQSAAMVAGIQQALANENRYRGPIDGRANPETVAALQVEAGLRAAPASAPKPATAGLDASARMASGLTRDDFNALLSAASKGGPALAKLKGLADSGDPDAQVAYGGLLSPVTNKGEAFAPDAEIAAAYYERAAAAEKGSAAGYAASLYDSGWGNLKKDPAKAAALAMRGLELRDDQTAFWLLVEESASWSNAFWASLQSELAKRGFYTNPIEPKRNDAIITAVRAYMKARR